MPELEMRSILTKSVEEFEREWRLLIEQGWWLHRINKHGEVIEATFARDRPEPAGEGAPSE